MKSKEKKRDPSLSAAQRRLRLAISVAQKRRHRSIHLSPSKSPQLTVSPHKSTASPRRIHLSPPTLLRQKVVSHSKAPSSRSQQLSVSPRLSIASPRRIHLSPSTSLHRKAASHSNDPSTSRSQQSVESPSPPHTITTSRRLRVTPSPSVRAGSQYYGSRGRGAHRGTKRDRVTRNPPTPTQSPHSMSPIADSSRVLDTSEEVPDTRDQESSTRKRGPRGANLNKNIPADASHRKVIHISGLNYLEHEVVRAITKDFKALFCGEETQWHKLDKDLVDIFYKSFQDRYQYEDNVDPETARLVWEERAKLRFAGWWVGVRKQCKKKTGSTNPAHWRLVCPEFVNEEDWDGILASWMTEKWKKRSAAGVANRKKVPGDEEGSYVRHTGGCVSFEIHRTRWETELGIQMTDIEFFEKLHKKEKGKGTWCDLRAERAATKYRQIVMKKNVGADLVDIPFDDEAWAEATCFTKTNNKGYGFGLTKQAERICRKAKRTKRFRTYNSRRDEAWIETEVATRVEKRMEAFEADMQQRVEEQVRVQVKEQVEKFFAGLQNQASTYW